MQKGVYSYNKTVDCAGPDFSSAPNQSHTKCRIPNFARTAGGRTPITRTVTKVGKKYFYIGNDAFSRKTGEYIDRNECNGGYMLYPTMQLMKRLSVPQANALPSRELLMRIFTDMTPSISGEPTKFRM